MIHVSQFTPQVQFDRSRVTYSGVSEVLASTSSRSGWLLLARCKRVATRFMYARFIATHTFIAIHI